ncbi:MAG: hypothetical protein RL518_754 [Pseudomonadota bacterium]
MNTNRTGANPHKQATELTESAPSSPLSQLTTPTTRPSASSYAKVFLGIGLTLSGSGCTPSGQPLGITNRENTSFRATSERYKGASSFGATAATLTLAESIGTDQLTKINNDFGKSCGSGQVAAMLTLLAQKQGNTISGVNEMFQQSRGTSISAANLCAAVTISGKSIQEINQLFDKSIPWDSEAASILVLAAACGNRPIEEINGLYKQNPETGLPGALLVLGSVISGKSMADMAVMYSQAQSLQSTCASELTLLAAVYKTPMQEINQLWKEASGSSEGSILLVQSALAARKPITTANHFYGASPSWSEMGSAILVLTSASKELAEREHGTGLIPLIYSRPVGKSRHTYFVPLVVPGSAGFEGKSLPLAPTGTP